MAPFGHEVQRRDDARPREFWGMFWDRRAGGAAKAQVRLNPTGIRFVSPLNSGGTCELALIKYVS